jgi:hypothetical protein
MRSIIPVFLALLLASSGALGQSNSTSFDDHLTAALRSLVADSSANQTSYRFFMEMQQKIDLVNLTTDGVQKIYTHSFGFGSANVTERALKMSLTSLTYDEADAENASVMAIDEYLINDTIYMKLDGNWTALKMPSVSEAWASQSTMAQQLEMINQSRLTLIGSEMVDGQDCYKVRADMDLGSMAGELSSEATSLVPMQGMNYSEIFSNMSLGIYYWISKDSHLLKKTDIVETFLMTPDSFGVPADQSEAQEMRITAEVSMLFQGYNENIAIKLPPEAEAAKPFPMGFMDSAQSGAVVLEGNVTVGDDAPPNETNETSSEKSTA